MVTTNHAGHFAMKHIYSEACDLHCAFQSILADKEQQRNALLHTASTQLKRVSGSPQCYPTRHNSPYTLTLTLEEEYSFPG